MARSRRLLASCALLLAFILTARAGLPTPTAPRAAPSDTGPAATATPTARSQPPATATPAPPPAPAAAQPTEPPPAPARVADAPVAPPGEPAEVVAVTDGDTIKVRLASGAVDTVRYIGVDTPETVDPRTSVECFGREASVRNATLVGGRTVYLERDVSDRDRYDRLLRYVWVVGDDGALRFANEELVKAGYAAASAYPPDVKYQGLLDDAERAARAGGLGLWGACEGPHAPLVVPPTATPLPLPTAAPARPTATRVPPTPVPPARSGNCDPSYPTVCIPPSPPDLDCGEIPHKRFTVLPPDRHRFDGDNDGIGCE